MKVQSSVLFLYTLCTLPLSKAWYNVWVTSLSDDNWRLFNANHSVNVSCSVPGNAYTALMKHGVLGDPYYRFNDDQFKWIAKDNWTYTRNIEFSQGVSDPSNIDLVFYGLDTIAMINFNGETLGQTHNMFHRYIYPIQKHIKLVNNTLEVTFKSPLMEAKDNAASYPYRVPPVCPPDVQNGDCNINFLRKEQASFSWDWGPSFPTAGIWKDVTIQGYLSAIISQVTAETRPVKSGDVDGNWVVSGTVYFDVGSDESRQVKGELVIEGVGMTENYYDMITLSTQHNYCTYSIEIDRASIDLWWPNGHGPRYLYDMNINFTSAEYGSEQSIYNIQLGFRTIELIQEPVPHSNGLSFYFKVNGKPIFMKGSNWIPADSFQDRITEEYLRRLLTSAADSHINMLRVWGGGVYESDKFYKLADEMGILIWQDMMFACALYPSDANFLETVTKEVAYQIRRLKHHPSIAIWAGNNENEGALMGPWWNLSGVPISTYKSDYIKLYIDTIRTVVMAEDNSRPFVSSSPSNGPQTEKQGWLSKNVQDPHYGDVHYYNYANDSWKYTTYPTPRFASEYGVQSWCSMEALRNVSVPSDLTINSNFTAHRQHHAEGNKQMLFDLEVHFGLSSSLDPQTYFKDYVFLTQINQAVAIKTESEHYLRMQSNLNNGEGMTMGALYWQLNDIWQAPTWASIEYGGKWKILQYYVKDFFTPVLLSPYLDCKTVRLNIINQSLPIMPHLAKDHVQSPRANSKLPVESCIKPDNDNCDTDTKLRFKPQLIGLDEDRFSRVRRSMYKSQQGVTFISHDSELCAPAEPFTVVISVYKWENMEPTRTWNLTIKDLSTASTEIYSSDISALLQQSSCPTKDHCFMYFTIPDCNLSNWLLLGYPKTAQGICNNTQLMVQNIAQSEPTRIDITLSTTTITPFVWLEADGHHGYFSKNGFIMVNKQVQVMYYPWKPMKTEEFDDFKQKLSVTSLCDVYKRS